MNSNQSNPPLLRNLSSKLAADNRQVGATMERIFEYVEALGDAASRSDWHEVRRMAELIFIDCLMYGFKEMADAADQIVQASSAKVSLADIEQSLDFLQKAGQADDANRPATRPRRRSHDEGD